MTNEQNEKVNELMRQYNILVDSNGVAYIDTKQVKDAQEAFEEAFSEIFCER